MSNRVVVFTDTNARILYVEDTKPYESMDNAAIDPDLSAVRGLPPHYWQLAKDHTIQPLSDSAKKSRDSYHAKNTDTNRIKLKPAKKSYIKYIIIAAALAAAIASYLWIR